MDHNKFSFLLFLTIVSVVTADLQVGFYKKTCPSVEFLVKGVVQRYIKLDPTLAPSLLRMHFHDSFVRGTEGSVLLNSTATNLAEKDSPPNNGSLRGFYVIDDAKAAVEAACEGVVSCADILAIVARDATSAMGGPFWDVECGRRDGTVSSFTEALQNLPPPFFNSTQLIARFQQKGLGKLDLVVLSGAHTIGFSHCSSINSRLYNFTGKGDTDPSLDAKYAQRLKQLCKPGDAITKIPMDPGSELKFDRSYYGGVVSHRGLFQSDDALIQDPILKALTFSEVPSFSLFFAQFPVSMVKMGRIGVLTGTQGQIRKNCALVNP